MLQHWLKELAVWAPGLRRVLIHQSAGEKESRRSISRQLLQSLSKWLERVRADRVNECIDEEDRLSMEPHSFCGTGYVIITTYENVRRNPDIYIQHSWSYVVLDEGTLFYRCSKIGSRCFHGAHDLLFKIFQHKRSATLMRILPLSLNDYGRRIG
jgi:SNF2 family DNA or RNA helicase